jgi:hypothetical protein
MAVGIVYDDKALCHKCSRDRNILELAGLLQVCQSCDEELFSGMLWCRVCGEPLKRTARIKSERENLGKAM